MVFFVYFVAARAQLCIVPNSGQRAKNDLYKVGMATIFLLTRHLIQAVIPSTSAMPYINPSLVSHAHPVQFQRSRLAQAVLVFVAVSRYDLADMDTTKSWPDGGYTDEVN